MNLQHLLKALKLQETVSEKQSLWVWRTLVLLTFLCGKLRSLAPPGWPASSSQWFHCRSPGGCCGWRQEPAWQTCPTHWSPHLGRKRDKMKMTPFGFDQSLRGGGEGFRVSPACSVALVRKTSQVLLQKQAEHWIDFECHSYWNYYCSLIMKVWHFEGTHFQLQLTAVMPL